MAISDKWTEVGRGEVEDFSIDFFRAVVGLQQN